MELIATGTVVDTDTQKIVASVYADETETNHYVTLAAKTTEVEAADANKAWNYADILGTATELVVPGFDGHEDVTLATPTVVRYAKTKAIAKDTTYDVYTALRFDY